MLARERRQLIVEMMRAGGTTVRDLSSKLGVSPMTIRRDLVELEQQGMLGRVHGGAFLSEENMATEVPYARKRDEFLVEKKQIGKAAAELVRAGETLILDAGSTTLEVGRHLPDNMALTVVSNDLQVLMALAGRSGITVVDTGGILLASVFTLIGSQTEAFIRSLHVDRVFLGADAISPEHGVTNRTLPEVAAKQAMLHAAREVVLVADSRKFGRRVFASVCSLEHLHVIVTDSGVQPEMAAAIQDRGIRMIIAGSEGVHQNE